MSFPTIPNVNPAIDINRDDVITLLLASIAFEELGLSHIINSEAEKIQYVLGTLRKRRDFEPPTINDLLRLDRSVERMLRNVIKSEMLLQFKLEDVLIIPPGEHIYRNVATVTATYGGVTVSDTDVAYYHTEGGTQQ